MKRLVAIFLNVIVISLLFVANPAYSLCTGGSSGGVTCTCDAELPNCSTNQTIKYNGTNWVCTNSGSSGGGLNYPLEVKGITSVTMASNLGYAAYSAQCNTDYPGSWFAKTSDFEQIGELPVIAAPARIHVDHYTQDIGKMGDVDDSYIWYDHIDTPDGWNYSRINRYQAFNCGNWRTTLKFAIPSPSSSTTNFIHSDTCPQYCRNSDRNVFSCPAGCRGTNALMLVRNNMTCPFRATPNLACSQNSTPSYRFYTVMNGYSGFGSLGDCHIPRNFLCVGYK
jgi:hypothetical protein